MQASEMATKKYPYTYKLTNTQERLSFPYTVAAILLAAAVARFFPLSFTSWTRLCSAKARYY